jgi:hypothetical protein
MPDKPDGIDGGEVKDPIFPVPPADPPTAPSDPPGTGTPPDDDPPFPKDHDPNATLTDGDGTQPPADPPADPPPGPTVIPQVTKDADNIAAKWESLSDTEKDQKVATLYNNRRPVLTALATKLGTTVDALVAEHAEVAPAAQQQFDTDQIVADAKAQATEEIRKELAPALQQADTAWAKAEISKWGEHNKFSQEEIDVLNDPNSEIRQNFDKFVHNPENGEKLTRPARLRLALASSPSLQQALVDRKIITGAHALVKTVGAKLPNGGGTSGKTMKSVLSDPGSSDADFLKELEKGGSKLVGQD